MSSNAETSRSVQPNVVFVVGDNVGWGDIGCYGGLAPTPRTRSAILTGRLPIRTGNCSVPLPGQGDDGLAPWGVHARGDVL